MKKIWKMALVISCHVPLLTMISCNYNKKLNDNFRDAPYSTLNKDETDLTKLKLVIASAVDSKIKEESGYDPYDYDVNVLKLFLNGKIVTEKSLKAIPNGSYVKFEYHLMKEDKIIGQGFTKIYFLANHELQSLEKLEKVEEVLIDKEKLDNNFTFSNFSELLNQNYPLYKSKHVITSNVAYLTGLPLIGIDDELKTHFYAFYGWYDDFFAHRILNWTYKNDPLREMKRIVNKLTATKIKPIFLNLNGKTKSEVNKELVDEVSMRIKKLLPSHYSFKINTQYTTLNTQPWFITQRDLWVPPLHESQIIKSVTFDDGINQFETMLFVKTELDGGAINLL